MKISHVKIHNWRSISDLDIGFENIMIFIGQNNHGKSNILSALLFFFGETICSELDFKKGSEELFVEIEFIELDEHDRKQFKKYLSSDNSICVRKQMAKGCAFEYHGYCEIPEDDWLKEEKINEYTNHKAINSTPLQNLVPSTGRLTKEIIKQAQEKYIDENKEKIAFKYDLETTNFLGLKSVAQVIFGNIFFIPAVKNATEEFNVKSKSVFNQLLSNVINEMSLTNPQYIDAKKRISELTQILNKNIDNGSLNVDRPKQITRLEKIIEDELEKWHTTINIEITPPDIDEVLKVGTSVWVDDGVPTDIVRKGHGLQRALIFALLKSWSTILKEIRDKIEETEDITTKRKASESNYFIFEEPELYLHPQAQREFFYSLKDLSELNNQVLLSTHSSYFIDLEMYKSICKVYKNNIEEGTKILQCTEELFTHADEKKNFNMSYWINPDRGELFFAEKVVLVEGPTEKTIIPFLAKNLGVFRYEYTMVDCGGKDNIKIYIHLLNKFKLPYIAVYDKDNQLSKNQNAIDSANKSSQEIEDNIDKSLGHSIILINDIEEEIGITDNNKGKPYFALKFVSDSTFSISESLRNKIFEIFK